MVRWSMIICTLGLHKLGLFILEKWEVTIDHLYFRINPFQQYSGIPRLFLVILAFNWHGWLELWGARNGTQELWPHACQACASLIWTSWTFSVYIYFMKKYICVKKVNVISSIVNPDSSIKMVWSHSDAKKLEFCKFLMQSESLRVWFLNSSLELQSSPGGLKLIAGFYP